MKERNCNEKPEQRIREAKKIGRTKKVRIATSNRMKADIKKMLNNKQGGGETRSL